MIRLLALLCLVLSAAPAGSHTAPEPREAARQALQHLEAKNYREAGRLALAAKKPAEDLRDYPLLEQLYSIIAVAGANIGNDNAVLLGNFQSAILRVRAYGARSAVSVDSDIALAMTYESRRNSDFEWPMQIAAANALATLRRLKDDGPLSPRLAEQEVWAHLMLANSYVRTDRPAMALRHFRTARELGRRGFLDAAALTHVQELIQRQENLLPRAAPAPSPKTCISSRQMPDERRKECFLAADRLYLDGKTARSRALYEALIADATPDHLPESRLPAALALHLALIGIHPPDHPDVIRSAVRTGNRLAVREYGTAALLAIHPALAALGAERTDRPLVDLLGHIARRAARGGDDDLALRLIDIMAVMHRQLTQKAEGDDLIPAAVEWVLLLLDATSFARINKYEDLAKRYFEAAARSLTSLAELPVDKIEEAVAPFADDSRGFVFPSAAAAHDLLGRLAILKGFDPARLRALTNWIVSEQTLRGNEAGALTLSERLIDMAGERHAGSLAHAELLAARAFMLVNPAASTPLTRQAYEIVRRFTGTEERQARLLLRLAAEARELGDYDAFIRLVETTEALAKSHPAIPDAIRSETERWRMDIALRAGNRPAATAHAERALDLQVSATADRHERRANPALSLAEVYAASNRMAEARTLYRRHIAHLADNPLLAGETTALAYRARFAAIEAYFDPTPALSDELGQLATIGEQAARRDGEVQRLIGRARTFASYGLKRGMEALNHGLRALDNAPVVRTETAAMREDRALLEITVGAALLAAEQRMDKP